MNVIKDHRNEEKQIVEESTAILNWLVKRIKSNQHSQARKLPKCTYRNEYDTKTKRSDLANGIVTSTSQPTAQNKTNVNIKHKLVTQDGKVLQCRKIWVDSCTKERSSKTSTYKKTGAAWVRPEPSTSKFIVEEENITKEKLEEIFKDMQSFMLPPIAPIETDATKEWKSVLMQKSQLCSEVIRKDAKLARLTAEAQWRRKRLEKLEKRAKKMEKKIKKFGKLRKALKKEIKKMKV